MTLIDRLILAALGAFALWLGYDFIQVKADLLEFGPRRDEAIDVGLFVSAVGFGTLVLSLIPNPKRGRR